MNKTQGIDWANGKDETVKQVVRTKKLLNTLALYEKQYPKEMFKYPDAVEALTGGLFTKKDN